MTATLCLLAFGAVMVYSASSPLGVLNGRRQRHRRLRPLPGLRRRSAWPRCTCSSAAGWRCSTSGWSTLLLLGSFALLLLVLVPGFGVQVNGARRWFAAGPIQFQPSELMKLALVLYVARYLADHPKRMRELPPGGGADRDRGRARRAC